MRRPLAVALATAALLVLTPLAGPASAQAPVTKRIAVVVIQNGDTANERTQLADTAYYRNVFFGGSDSLATWMTAVTHGQLTYVPAGDGVFTAAPSTELANADKGGCHTGLARTNAESHLSAAGVSWDALAVVYDIASCGWGGLGQVPGKITWYPPRPSLSAIVHEIGHNQGYPHQSKKDCAKGDLAVCKDSGYSGNTPMGSGGSGRGYSSVEMLHSGWAQPGWKQTATSPGTFSLKPLHAAVSVTGVRILEYKASSTVTYIVETRAPASGVDSAISNPGVRVYVVTRTDYRNGSLINPGTASTPFAPAGTVIKDVANKISITVRSSSSSGAQVSVESLSPKPSSPAASKPAAPSPSVTPSREESPSSSASADPVPDKESDLIDAAGAPPRKSGLSAGTIFLIIGLGMVLALAAVTGYFLRPGRRKARHRKPLFERL